MSANTLLMSDILVKERTGLHTNIDPKLIYPDIKIAQDLFIQPILGSNLFLKLQSLVDSGEILLDENIKYKSLLDNFITEALLYYTLSRLPLTLSYQIFNKGVLRKNDDNATQPEMSELIEIANEFKNTAEFYGRRLLMFLKANLGLFPEYNTYNTSLDAINPISDNYTSGIWLDDDEGQCTRGMLPYWPYKP